jgi:hypothetical protein
MEYQFKRGTLHRPQRRMLALVALVVGLSFCLAGCHGTDDAAEQLDTLVAPYRFSLVRWSLGRILFPDKPMQESRRWEPGSPAATELVLSYFSLVSQISGLEAQVNMVQASHDPISLAALQRELQRLQQRKLALRDTVEWLLGLQISETLKTQGIYHPFYRYAPLRLCFPPMNFELDALPHILVISPRDRIERMKEVVLVQVLDDETAESIEAQTDALGVSSLVVGLGGFGGTYPTFVADDVTLDWTVSTATEEWLHQYLAFTPLGFAYLLHEIGWSRNYDVAALNETLAGIFSAEVGDLVLEQYYPSYAAQLRAARAAAPRATEGQFSFNAEMRQVHLTVDQLLAEGKVDEAEQFMEQRRQYLMSQGYYIRKLNQAYFAFYGTYAAEPTSVDPLGDQMRELRARSPTLRSFLQKMSGINGRQSLLDEIGEPRKAQAGGVAVAP